MQSTQATESSAHQVRSIGRASTVGAAVAVLLCTLVAASPGLARQEPEAGKMTAEQRRQRMEERRKERSEAAEEMRARRNDPEYLKQNAWWNDDGHVETFGLDTAQRKTADAALTRFLTRREEATEESREAQMAFFDALAAGASDVQAKKDRMIAAMTAMTVANADLRIAVIGALTPAQRTKLQEEQPRLLRSNWADPRSAGRSDSRLQRRRGSNPNG